MKIVFAISVFFLNANMRSMILKAEKKAENNYFYS